MSMTVEELTREREAFRKIREDRHSRGIEAKFEKRVIEELTKLLLEKSNDGI